MPRIALILLLLTNIAARGQTHTGARGQTSVALNKDSLRWMLVTQPADTAKLATLLRLAHQFGTAQPDSAISYFQEADRLSHQLGLGRYRPSGGTPWVTILLTAVLLLAAALTIGILVYYRQRRVLGLQTKEALNVRGENVRLKALLDGRIDEQQRISREMQNEIGTGLTSLLSMIRTLPLGGDADPATIPADPATITADPATITADPATIMKLQQTADQLIRKTDEIAWMLDHEENSLGSLISSVRRNAAHLLGQANIDLRLDIDNDIPEMAVPQEFRRDVYLIVHEAVYNTVRHSGASLVEIGIHIDGGQMTILVRDNGKGIYKAGGNHRGNGMKNMQRQVEQINGRMEITAGAGTAITVVSPLPYL